MSQRMIDSVNDLDVEDMEAVVETVVEDNELLEFLIDLGLNTDRLEKITGVNMPRFDESQRELLGKLRQMYTENNG